MKPSEIVEIRSRLLNELTGRRAFEQMTASQTFAAAEEWLIGNGVPLHQIDQIISKQARKRIHEIQSKGRVSATKPHVDPPKRVPGNQFAKCLRVTATDSEKTLWKWLHEHSGMNGWVFQHPVSDYVIDFYHPKTRIGIELDGVFHAGRKAYDSMRDTKLKLHGIKIIRVPSRLMFTDPVFVYKSIKQAVEAIMKTKMKSASDLLKAAKEANGPTE